MWSYRVPPDIAVTVRAKARPGLLSRCLGEESAVEGEASLLLDLASRGDERSLESGEHVRTVRGVYKAIPWSCRISRRSDGGWNLGFKSLLLREYLALHIALLPVLKRLLLDREVALVTGAAFEVDGAGTLVAGLTGRGKTTVLLGALERGANLIGDEYLGLSASAAMTPVVRALALRRTTLDLAPQALRRLRQSRRFALRFAELVTRLTRGRLDPLVHVSPAELEWARSSPDKPVPVRRLFWLDAQSGDGELRCEPMDLHDAVEQLARMQTRHDVAYGDIGALLDVSDGAGCTDNGSRWRATLERGLSGVDCYRLLFPAARVPVAVLGHILGPAQV